METLIYNDMIAKETMNKYFAQNSIIFNPIEQKYYIQLDRETTYDIQVIKCNFDDEIRICLIQSYLEYIFKERTKNKKIIKAIGLYVSSLKTYTPNNFTLKITGETEMLIVKFPIKWKILLCFDNCAHIAIENSVKNKIVKTFLAQEWIENVVINHDNTVLINFNRATQATIEELKTAINQLCENVCESEITLDKE